MYKDILKGEGSVEPQIAAGSSHSLYIDKEGNLWAWGRNKERQLGDGTTEDSLIPKRIIQGTKFKKVSAGMNNVIAIDDKGNLWAWGNNSYGELGDGTTDSILEPKKIKEEIKFKEISIGYTHSTAIDDKGNLWAWGNNNYGQLGDGTTNNSLTPKMIKEGTFKKVQSNLVYGYANNTAIDEEGNLWVWGRNNYGQLGDGTSTDSHIPIKISKEIEYIDISTYGNNNLAIDKEENLWSWGFRCYTTSEIGLSQLSKPTQIMNETKFKSAIAGAGTAYEHSVAIDEEGNLWSWGYNDKGQLGIGTTYEGNVAPQRITSGVKFKQISKGYNGSNLAIDEEGNIWVWGYNASGQLGDGTTNNSLLPKKIN